MLHKNEKRIGIDSNPGGVLNLLLFGPPHQTDSRNSRTLLPRISKMSDFFFMPLGQIVEKFQVKLIYQGVAAIIFQQEVMKN